MVREERRGAEKLIDRAKEAVEEAVDRLTEALDTLLGGGRPAPALAPVRQPTAEEIRRHRQRQGRY